MSSIPELCMNQPCALVRLRLATLCMQTVLCVWLGSSQVMPWHDDVEKQRLTCLAPSQHETSLSWLNTFDSPVFCSTVRFRTQCIQSWTGLP